MERRVSFEFDGREIAKSIINEKREMEKELKDIIRKAAKELDNIIIAQKITEKLSLELKKEVVWLVDSDNVAEFHIYKNKYDYDIVKIKLLTWRDKSYLEIEEYIKIIKYMLLERGVNNNLYTMHKASTLETVIVDMLEENECEDIYILNGLLIYEGLEFCLKDIKEYHVYNDEECIIKIWDEFDGWYVIDFDNETIQEECEV